VLLLAGPAEQARFWGANGSHGRGRSVRGDFLRSAPVHDLAEIRAAENEGADLLFLSPVFPTRSHPGEPVLGPDRFARLAHSTRLPVIALGGMDAEKGRLMRALGAHGWAGIDYFLRD
jgi:thiamine-phosphate pyrophosphorylase